MSRDLEGLAQGAAEELARHSRQAVADRGRFLVALSGGSTPKRMYQLLADRYVSEVDWDRTHVFWSDDRYVHPSDPASNEGLARRELLSLVPIPDVNVHGMYREGGVGPAADAYDEEIRSLGMDLTFLGIGSDGHTASLFPYQPAVHEKIRSVVAAHAPVGVSERITMTVPMLIRSRRVLFMVAGEDKAEALERTLYGPEDWDETPAQAVARHAPNVLWLVDEAAAYRLNR